jgi:hypothetical protein
MVERALAAGARPAWVVADAVYGADSKLRFFLEERQQPYVVAVASNQCVWVGLTQYRVKTLAAQAPAAAWRRLTVGAGAKGPRRFEWAALPINHPYDPRHWQRSRAFPPLLRGARGLGLLPGLWSGRHAPGGAGPGGGAPLSPSRRPLPKARGKSAWINMKCVPGWAGTGT